MRPNEQGRVSSAPPHCGVSQQHQRSVLRLMTPHECCSCLFWTAALAACTSKCQLELTLYRWGAIDNWQCMCSAETAQLCVGFTLVHFACLSQPCVLACVLLTLRRVWRLRRKKSSHVFQALLVSDSDSELRAEPHVSVHLASVLAQQSAFGACFMPLVPLHN